MRTLKLLLLSGVISLAATNLASAETYRAAAWQPDTDNSIVGMLWFTNELAKATDGEITFEVFTGGVLVPPKSML